MDVREKLVELIGEVQTSGLDYSNISAVCKTSNDTLADHLIANGVTVQEWISVEDRLPDVVSTHKTPWDNYTVSIRVLCACLQADGKKMVKEGYCKVYEGYEAIPHWKIPGTIHSVTHWMPLPEPPLR